MLVSDRFGSLDAVNIAAFEVTKRRFKWGYSNIRGFLMKALVNILFTDRM